MIIQYADIQNIASYVVIKEVSIRIALYMVTKEIRHYRYSEVIV